MSHEAPPRPPFKVSGLATIRHLNVRKEGPEDDKIIAVDVKLMFSQIDRRLCAYFDDALEAFLWRGDTNALIVRNAFLSPVVYINEISSATVEIGTRTFQGCEVKKFSIEPADGGVITLGCSVSLYPDASDVSDLAKIVQDDERVTIEGPPDLFADSGAQAASSLENMAREDGITAALTDNAGNVVIHFGSGQDPMYGQAVTAVLENRKASISLVQRHLKVGYNRAARMLEDMEKAGVVSPMDGSGARKVLQTN